MPGAAFTFNRFAIRQDRCALKVGTDGIVLGAWAGVEGAARILDLGTGTGLLALMAAQRNPAARIDAVEIDDASAEQAAENAAASPWAGRVRVHRMDARRLRTPEPFDLILCNPPYYAGEMDSPHARAAVARHGAELSFAELARTAAALLADRGRLACIIPLGREAELLGLCAAAGLVPVRRCVLRYLAGRPPKRVLLELARSGACSEEPELVVEEEPGRRTACCRALLAPFMPGI